MFLVIFSSPLLQRCSNASSSELLGTWVLTYDPDSPNGPSDDMMVFLSDKNVDLCDSTEVYLHCTYIIKNDEIIISGIVRGKRKTLKMNFSSDNRNILLNPSGAEYTKQ